MAPPKKIIALTPLELNQYQICLFRREGIQEWHIVKILIENAPESKVEAIEKMKLCSEQLKIPWQKKPLKDVTRKRLHNAEKRKARKQAQLAARAIQQDYRNSITEKYSFVTHTNKHFSYALIWQTSYIRRKISTIFF